MLNRLVAGQRGRQPRNGAPASPAASRFCSRRRSGSCRKYSALHAGRTRYRRASCRDCGRFPLAVRKVYWPHARKVRLSRPASRRMASKPPKLSRRLRCELLITDHDLKCQRMNGYELMAHLRPSRLRSRSFPNSGCHLALPAPSQPRPRRERGGRRVSHKTRCRKIRVALDCRGPDWCGRLAGGCDGQRLPLDVILTC